MVIHTYQFIVISVNYDVYIAFFPTDSTENLGYMFQFLLFIVVNYELY